MREETKFLDLPLAIVDSEAFGDVSVLLHERVNELILEIYLVEGYTREDPIYMAFKIFLLSQDVQRLLAYHLGRVIVERLFHEALKQR